MPAGAQHGSPTRCNTSQEETYTIGLNSFTGLATIGYRLIDTAVINRKMSTKPPRAAFYSWLRPLLVGYETGYLQRSTALRVDGRRQFRNV